MKKFSICMLLLTTFLLSCSKQETGPGAPKVTEPTIVADISTPDKALKSYWAVRDAMRLQQNTIFENNFDKYRETEAALKTVADGAYAKNLQVEKTPVQSFSRDLIEVKVESESRAVIFAAIRNTTAIPAGADVSKSDEQRRRDGEKYKYVLERDKSGWKISEMWEMETYPNLHWKKTRPSDGKPLAPTFTYEGN